MADAVREGQDPACHPRACRRVRTGLWQAGGGDYDQGDELGDQAS
jgi:hypothetical protein